jgi:nitrite reductase/ring-hydroxylating ferredoxin subunit
VTGADLDLTDSVEVCGLEELQSGAIREVRVGGLRAAAVLHDSRVYVFQAQCPHRGGPLTRGALRPRVTGERSGEMVLDTEHPVVTCPWHNFEYSLETGEALWNPKLCIRLFASEVVDGRVRAWKDDAKPTEEPES